MRKLNAKQKRVKNIVLDLGADVIGSFIFAVGLISFVGPANIAPGGVSAISLMINYVCGWPIGLLNFLINVPLLVLSFIYLGRGFTLKTIKTLIINTLMIDAAVAPFIPVYTGDRLLGSVYGGVLIGVGMAMIFLRGSTTGGTDIASYLIQKRFPHLSIGRAMMFIDGVIIASSMFVFNNIEAGLFGVISLFTTTKILDSIIYGVDKGSMVTVVSPKNREIGNRIMEELGRGVTYIKGEGGYSGKSADVLLCAVRKAQFARLKAIVYDVDADAFVVVTEAGQILGEGFTEDIK